MSFLTIKAATEAAAAFPSEKGYLTSLAIMEGVYASLVIPGRVYYVLTGTAGAGPVVSAAPAITGEPSSLAASILASMAARGLAGQLSAAYVAALSTSLVLNTVSLTTTGTAAGVGAGAGTGRIQLDPVSLYSSISLSAKSKAIFGEKSDLMFSAIAEAISTYWSSVLTLPVAVTGVPSTSAAVGSGVGTII